MDCIVAVDRNWAIGKDGGMLVHLPGDLRYFKEKTLGKTVLMGRKTLESLPGGRPLAGRRNIVLSSAQDFAAEGCTVVHSLEEARELVAKIEAEEGPGAVMLIGGASLYEQMLAACNRCYVTKIDGAYAADCYFPNLDEAKDVQFQMVWESAPQEDGGVQYRFTCYERKE